MYIKCDLKRGSHPEKLTSIHNIFPQKEFLGDTKKKKMPYKYLFEHSMLRIPTKLKNTYREKFKTQKR